MDMNSINIADIIINDIDLEPINLAIKARAQALASQLPPEAADQLVSDMDAFECAVTSEGNSVSFKLNVKEFVQLAKIKYNKSEAVRSQSQSGQQDQQSWRGGGNRPEPRY